VQRGWPGFSGPRRSELVSDPTGKVGRHPVRHKPRKLAVQITKGIDLLPALRAIAKMERDRLLLRHGQFPVGERLQQV
jgi:hypothetical protein